MLHLHDQRNLGDKTIPAGIVIYNDPEQVIFYLDDTDDRKSVTITRSELGKWELKIFKKGKPIYEIALE
jgi:hypothetical protein